MHYTFSLCVPKFQGNLYLYWYSCTVGGADGIKLVIYGAKKFNAAVAHACMYVQPTCKLFPASCVTIQTAFTVSEIEPEDKCI